MKHILVFLTIAIVVEWYTLVATPNSRRIIHVFWILESFISKTIWSFTIMTRTYCAELSNSLEQALMLSKYFSGEWLNYYHGFFRKTTRIKHCDIHGTWNSCPFFNSGTSLTLNKNNFRRGAPSWNWKHRKSTNKSSKYNRYVGMCTS